MIINENTVEQINIALLDLERKLSTVQDSKADIDSLKESVNIIRASLNETKDGLQSGNTYNINITGNATTATTAGSAASANHATTADSATNATNATNADKATKDANGDTITSTYQKVSDKNAVAGYVQCDKTANGQYILVATVNNGTTTYSWVART